jgi:regulator of sigma E protease
MLINLLAFIFVLGVLVILHEAGHFFAARAVGAPVEVFSVGFGKRLWGFKRGGTDYRISLIPIGGYVRVVGLGPDESQVTGAAEADDELLPRWKRGIILLAGPVTNIIAAVGFLAIAFMLGVKMPAYQTQPPRVGWVEPDSPAAGAGVKEGDLVTAVDGLKIKAWSDLETSLLTSGGHKVHVELQRDERQLAVSFTPTKFSRYGFGYSGILPPLDSVVVELNPGSPAQHAGLRPGDRIVGIDGQPVHQFYDMMRLISPHPAEKITVTYVRSGKRQQVQITPRDVGGEGKIGIPVVFPTRLEKLAPAAAIATSIRECRRMTVQTFRILGKLIRRKTSLSQVSGPIDIARISGEAARSGIRTLIWFLGLISLQLGIFNLLPIPVLDGGHLAILSFETVRRRDLPLRVKERILEVGFVLLILLMVVVLYNDILKVLPENMYHFLYRG